MLRWWPSYTLLLAAGWVLLAGNQTWATPRDTEESEVAVTCRDRTHALPPRYFRYYTCAACYEYLFRDRGQLRGFNGYLFAPNSTQAPLVADADNDTVRVTVCDTLDDDGCFRWTACCGAAAACCEEQRRTPAHAVNGTPASCPRTWDGYACWGDTPAASTAYVACPDFLPHVIPGVDAYKTCNANATWYRDPKSGMEWSNFTDCLSVDNFKRNIFVNIACNSISLLLLVPSTLVFLVYRPLRVQHRIRLHINLFTSFILTNIVFILWDVLIVYDRLQSDTTQSRMHANSSGCKLLYILTRYTRCANFLWMLSEAYYLHRLIAKAFEPPKSLVPFYLLAWGFPWVPVSIYSIFRAFYADESCWVQNFGGFEWLIYTPNLLSLAMNVVFLSNILRILLTQLQAHPNEPSNYRRALKATFVLIPLFGIQLVCIIYRPPPSVLGAMEYAVFESIVTHSQGFFVALVFCFLNGEVISHLRSSFGPVCHARRGGWDMKHSMSGTTQVTQADPVSCRPNNTSYIPMKPITDKTNGEAK